MRDYNFSRFVLTYAFRSLWRNRRRTLLTMSTVALSVAVTIVGNRYGVALIKLWQDGAADTGVAHAQVHAQGYWQKPEGLRRSLTLLQASKVEQAIRSSTDVQVAVRRLEVEGLVTVGEEETQTRYFLGLGVQPAQERQTSPRLFTKKDAGSFVRDDDIDGVTVGKGLAAALGLNIGDWLTLIATTADGSTNAIDCTVIGIVDAAIPSFSQRIIYMHIEHLQKLVRLPGRYTELAIKLKKGVSVEAFVKRFQPQVQAAGAEIRGWWAIEPLIQKVGQIWTTVISVVSGLLFLTACLSVLNIIFMLVGERRVEIGTLVAIGAQGRDIKLLFASEAMLIGIFGGLVGWCLGTLSVACMAFWGVPFESPFGSGKLVVYPTMDLFLSVMIFLGGIGICILAALPPARRAAALTPVRALRGL